MMLASLRLSTWIFFSPVAPANEIRFIQECKNEKARKAVISAMNKGSVRVLFGSTSMLGTGVNAQKRAVAIHHLDTPWRPSDLEQRNGRAVRASNEIAKHFADNKVDVIIYAVEKLLDYRRFVIFDSYLRKKEPIIYLNRRKLKVFCFCSTFFCYLCSDFPHSLCWVIAVLSGYLKTEQLTPC